MQDSNREDGSVGVVTSRLRHKWAPASIDGDGPRSCYKCGMTEGQSNTEAVCPANLLSGQLSFVRLQMAET
jgi:hypothetical protein